MKANELMIGDLVITPAGIAKVLKIDGDNNTIVICQHDGRLNGGLVDEAEPIQLTPEILEKNGFSGKMYAICEIDENRKLQFYYHEHRLKLYWVGVDEYNNSSVVTDEIFRCHCMYVHELQHALKLCHIEKTIEL